MKKILALAIGFCTLINSFAQTATIESSLENLAQSYLTAHNNTDTLQYQQWMAGTQLDAAAQARKIQGFKNGCRMVGPVQAVHTQPLSDSSIELLVKDQQFDAWWKIRIYANSTGQFKDRTLQPHRFSTELIQKGKLTNVSIQEQLDNYLSQKLQPFSGEILITKGAQTIYHKKIGNTGSYGLASLSKIFAATAILQLRDQGKLSLEDSLAKHLPFIKNPAIRPLTIRQLLTHSSGLGDFFEQPEYHQLKATLKTDLDFLPILEADKLRFTPGTQWQYSNNGFAWLGILISTITKQPYEQYLKQAIFEPANMTETTVQNGSGGGVSTIADLNKFAAALRAQKLLNKNSNTELLSYTFNNEYGLGSEHAQIGKEHIVGHSGGFIKVCTELNIYLQS
ncbi:MAG: beta-lactamase family protein, partial [Flavihumibacter sp.]|nr:beta-lactamase family protein [Flavihumibacter sp.]